MSQMTTMAFWIYAGDKRPQAWHVGQSVTTFGTPNLVPQSPNVEGDDITGAKVDIDGLNDCGSIEVLVWLLTNTVFPSTQLPFALAQTISPLSSCC